MREAIAFHLFSGDAWFTSGAVLIVIALIDLTRTFAARRRAASVARVAGLVACAFAALSGTPTPLWLAIAAVVILAFFLFAAIGSHLDVIRRTVACGALLVVAAALAAEVPHHFARPAMRPSDRPLVVIGDSLSSGGFGERVTWPELLSSSRPVSNLSRPSENVSLARRDVVLAMVQAMADSVIVLEIGGNDMLDRTPLATFEGDLHELVAEARGRDVVMLELPILPGLWRYGAAQRRVARIPGVVLVPKRVLARILLDPANTIDGLHLTQRGHDELAHAIAPWIP